MWTLKEFNIIRLYEEKLSEKMDREGGGWDSMRVALLEVAREVCGETRGRGHRERETWWWNEEVQEAIRGRRKLSRGGRGEKTEENKRRYREKARHTKRAVAAAKARAWEEWSEELHTEEERRKMFKIANQMKKERTLLELNI